jgi:mannose/fructose/N-acetylgalactosamine-specific phosphotransferase system component IIC
MLPLPAGGAPHLFFLAAVAALIGGLSAVERKGALQLMLSRPIVLAPILGWGMGDAQGGLLLGIPLELLFLGGVNLGGSLPDNESLLAGTLTAMVVPAGLAARTGVDAPLAALGLALLLPLAFFGRRLDRASEARNTELMEEALARAARGDPDAARVNLRGLLLPFGAAAGICALGVVASPVLALVRLNCRAAELSALEGAWHAVWAVAAACAVRAIRDLRGPALAAICAATVIAITLAIRGLS